MLDTNVFNDVLDGKVDIAFVMGKRVVATHIQYDEIGKTRNDDRRAALLKIFEVISAHQSPTSSSVAGISVAGAACASSGSVVPTESAVFGVSRWGASNWVGNSDVFSEMRNELNLLNNNKRNNTEDVLIAETVLKNKWVLVTSDKDLTLVAQNHGCLCSTPTACFSP